MRRLRALETTLASLRRGPCVALLGPRQAGKTTLARRVAKTFAERGDVAYFDLENPFHVRRLDAPHSALAPLKGLIVLDEIQRMPEIFPILRVLIDERLPKRKFLVLGSASGELLKQTSESLAGRITFQELMPFAIDEASDLRRLWLRGGFPRAYLPSSRIQGFRWLADYVTTFLERDIPALGLRLPAPAMRRFWMMLAHHHAGTFNSSELARALGTSDKSTRHYLDVLTATFMVRQLPPWFENISKRQVKAPKVYFRDTGLLHSLLGISRFEQLEGHPKVGASWEGFALESVIRELSLRDGEAYFWATHSDAELDLLCLRGGKRFGFEFKREDAPRITRSMRIATSDLGLAHIFVVYPGEEEAVLAPGISALGLKHLRDPKAEWRKLLPKR